MRLRVVVYNVRGFRDGLEHVAAVVNRAGPDLLLLQESGSRRSLRRFAKATGMRAAGDPWSPMRRRVKNAVLVRPPWRIVSKRLHRFERSARFYPRGALIAQVGRAGRRVWAISIHLGLSPGERHRHARELTDMVASLGGPLVLGGDLNDLPDGKAATWIAERYWDAWDKAGDGEGLTFPAGEPTARIDYVFVSQELRVAGVAVPQDADARRASDHRAVVADLELEEAPGA